MNNNEPISNSREFDVPDYISPYGETHGEVPKQIHSTPPPPPSKR